MKDKSGWQAYQIVKHKETKEEYMITMFITGPGAASIMRLSDRALFIVPINDLDENYKLVKEKKKDGQK